MNDINIAYFMPICLSLLIPEVQSSFEKMKKKSYITISVHCTVSDPLEHIIFASWYVEKVHGTGSALT